MNPIVRSIVLWFAETFPATVLEIILEIIIESWNQTAIKYNYSFATIGVLEFPRCTVESTSIPVPRVRSVQVMLAISESQEARIVQMDDNPSNEDPRAMSASADVAIMQLESDMEVQQENTEAVDVNEVEYSSSNEELYVEALDTSEDCATAGDCVVYNLIDLWDDWDVAMPSRVEAAANGAVESPLECVYIEPMDPTLNVDESLRKETSRVSENRLVNDIALSEEKSESEQVEDVQPNEEHEMNKENIEDVSNCNEDNGDATASDNRIKICNVRKSTTDAETDVESDESENGPKAAQSEELKGVCEPEPADLHECHTPDEPTQCAAEETKVKFNVSRVETAQDVALSHGDDRPNVLNRSEIPRADNEFTQESNRKSSRGVRFCIDTNLTFLFDPDVSVAENFVGFRRSAGNPAVAQNMAEPHSQCFEKIYPFHSSLKVKQSTEFQCDKLQEGLGAAVKILEETRQSKPSRDDHQFQEVPLRTDLDYESLGEESETEEEEEDTTRDDRSILSKADSEPRHEVAKSRKFSVLRSGAQAAMRRLKMKLSASSPKRLLKDLKEKGKTKGAGKQKKSERMLF